MQPNDEPLARSARAGAYKRNLPHVQSPGQTIFVTFATFGRWTLPESVRDSILKHCLHDNQRRYRLHAAVVMPEHVHLLLTLLRDQHGNTFAMAEIMSGIKGASAHSVNKALARRGVVWQDESFDRALRSDENTPATAEYICTNLVRAGLGQTEADYRWLWRSWVNAT